MLKSKLARGVAISAAGLMIPVLAAAKPALHRHAVKSLATTTTHSVRRLSTTAKHSVKLTHSVKRLHAFRSAHRRLRTTHVKHSSLSSVHALKHAALSNRAIAK